MENFNHSIIYFIGIIVLFAFTTIAAKLFILWILLIAFILILNTTALLTGTIWLPFTTQKIKKHLEISFISLSQTSERSLIGYEADLENDCNSSEKNYDSDNSIDSTDSPISDFPSDFENEPSDLGQSNQPFYTQTSILRSDHISDVKLRNSQTSLNSHSKIQSLKSSTRDDFLNTSSNSVVEDKTSIEPTIAQTAIIGNSQESTSATNIITIVKIKGNGDFLNGQDGVWEMHSENV